MANLSKERRDRMIEKLEELKLLHNDDASIASLNEIENALREKKYGLVWEQHSETVDDMLKENIPVLVADPERRLCKDENLPWNFIIEGENLQALYLLEKTHRGKVDCIYIDPPYNTGAHDWKYNNDYVDDNDQYRHSKWLSMMKSRLVVAKKLLNPNNSVLICTIDEKEYLHLGCLLEELFPNAKMQMISSVINPKGSARDGFSRSDEYIFFIMLGDCTPERLPLSNEWSSSAIVAAQSTEQNNNPNKEPGWTSMMRRGTGSLRIDSPGLYYPIYADPNTKKIVKIGEVIPAEENRGPEYEGLVQILPIRKNGEQGRWQVGNTELKKRIEQGRVRLGSATAYGYVVNYLPDGEWKDIQNGVYEIVGYAEDGSLIGKWKNESPDKLRMPPTQWKISAHNASENGTTILTTIIGEKRFSFPKSLYAVHDAIRFFVASKKDAIIVDFFAGSGTTMHAVNLLNAEDGGSRKCIMITNNEISEADITAFATLFKNDESCVTTERKPKKKGGETVIEEILHVNTQCPQFKQYADEHGIAKYITWPRTVCSIEGHDVNGNSLKGNYLGNNLPMADGFQTNVKYFKCEWTPRKPDDYLLSNALCLHVKELIELQTAHEVDGIKNVIILNKTDFKKTFDDPAKAELVEHVWVNENLVFNAAEMQILREKKFKYIPREYFSQELKEVGEYV